MDDALLLLAMAALFGSVGWVLPGRFLGPASLLLGLSSLLAWIAWAHGRSRTRRGGRDGLRYRGWRQDRFVRWDRVREVGADRQRYDLAVQPRGTREEPVRVPLVMVDASPESLVAAIDGRRSARRPGRGG